MTDWSQHRSWELVLPPSRPTTEELSRIRLALRSVRRAEPIAILGSTPEYRDLLARAGFSNVHLIDASETFHDAMTQMCAYRVSLKERFHHETWQDHFATGREYRAILSDLTLGNIPYVDRGHLFEALSRALVPGGMFIDKVLTNEGRRFSTAQIADHFRNLPVNLRTINDFNCIALFCSEVVFDGQVDSTRSYDVLSHEFREDPHLLELIMRCEEVTPRGMRWHYGLPWERVQPDYIGNRLQLLSRHGQDGGSPYRDHAYQFLYRRS